MTSDLQASPGRRRRARPRSRTPGIRIRALMIALIPSAALLITGVSVAGYLISGALSARAFATYYAQTSGLPIKLESAFEQERTLSLRALGGDRQALAGLRAQWSATNSVLSQLNATGNGAESLNPQALAGTSVALHEMPGRLASMRQSVQTGRTSAIKVDAFYTQLAGMGSPSLTLIALSSPGVTAAVDMITVSDLNRVPDLHSRVVGLGAGWVARGVVDPADRLILGQLAGAYRTQLQALASRLPQPDQADYAKLVAGKAWKTATSGEDDLAKSGKLAMPLASWLAAENTVSADLLGTYADDLHYAQSVAVSAANQTLSKSVLVGSLVLALAVAAFAASLVLANGLVRRLRRLRAKTLELAGVTLPSMVRRIGDGEPVDIESEVAMSGYGSDEIGQVAEAFNTAQRTAAATAVAEARTRAGVNKVFLDIAHRSQVVVHRQLELLDVAEAKQSDPEHLELLFQLDHLATRARRNAENLLILGGGQPGRKWRQPAALEDIVRSAVSETEHFARVSTVRLPDVRVQGAVVGDLVHLLAELVDNATVFSPPDAAVTVGGNLVGKGVVVEVEDQGLGIDFAERERLNETLANPPDFQVMSLSGQRHLGLFVVGQLAHRHGIAVSLLESAYGGIKAIVLIPASVVEAGGAAGGDLPAVAGPGGTSSSSRLWPGRPRARCRRRGAGKTRTCEGSRPGNVFRRPPSWPDSQASAALPGRWETPPGPPGPVPARARRGRAPLPRRERLANLAPGLRPDADGAAGHASPRRPPRSPEEARGSMSAFQRGTRLGRDFADEDNR